MDKQKTLYEIEHFAVGLAEFSDPVIDEPVVGYGIWNKVTGVREAEARRLEVAIVLARQYDKGYRALLTDLADTGALEDALALLPPANTKAG